MKAWALRWLPPFLLAAVLGAALAVAVHHGLPMWATYLFAWPLVWFGLWWIEIRHGGSR